MKAFLSNLRRRANGAVIVAGLGAISVAYGVGLIYLPAAFIVGGAMVILAALDSRS
jgi:hypothetical protein